MNVIRLFKHLLAPSWWGRGAFSAADRQAIGAAVAASEHRQRGELRVVIEGPLSLLALLNDVAPRQRAVDLFGRLRVWDTEENSGILIYVQLIDRRVEILADRGIAARVPQAAWDALCRDMEAAFLAGQYRQGVLAAIDGATQYLAAHFPAGKDNPNELPDVPLML
jgi:uncharacterized membrane protein YgcG